jgi:hypothetical protein
MKKGISLVIFCLLVFVGVQGNSQYKYIHSWDTDTYFGHVIYPEAKHDGKDAVVLREGQSSPEVADLNLPLAPGDTIKTGERRCEVQFDTGTVIRLDRDSELKIETILAQSLSSRNQLTNLLLIKGQAYVLYKRYVRKEIFQIITPNSAVKLNHNSVSLIKAVADGGTDVYVSEGRGYALYGSNENAIKKKSIKKSQKITINPDHQVVAEQYEEIDDFEAWNEKLNREFLEFHEGKAVLPLPIQKLSRGVFYFAQKFSNLYGEWLWDSLYGYVWRPFLNDRSYPWGGWMPYHQGRWTSVQGQLFWVPSEPWGWVPYHLGIWMWNKTKGWVWIPGSVFAPAWVDWAFYAGSYCWRPWSLLDWYGYSVYADGYFPYLAYSIHPDDDPYIADKTSRPEAIPVRQVLTKDQLKSKKAAPYPLPKEFKEAYKRVVVAMKKGEDWIFSPLKEMPNQVLAVSPEDLNARQIHEKAVKLTSLSVDKSEVLRNERLPAQQSRLKAEQTYMRNEKMSVLREKIDDLIGNLEGMKNLPIRDSQVSSAVIDSKAQEKQDVDNEKRVGRPFEVRVQSSLPDQTNFSNKVSPADVSDKSRGSSSDRLRSNPSSARFRDWNPDIKVARSAGVSIRYSSRSNEIRCPELNLSSRHVTGSRGYDGPHVQLTSRGPVTTSGSSSGVYSGGSSGRSSSQASSSGGNSSGEGAKSSGSSGKSKK